MSVQEISEKDVRSLLPVRKRDAHKGDFGRVLLVCGSVGYTGAAAMAAMAAARCGSGLIYLGVPEPIWAVEAGKLLEPMVFPLPAKDGMLAERAADALLLRVRKTDAVLAGPGLGISRGTEEVVCRLARECECPLVLDADGINVMSGHIDILRDRKAPLIVTPHPGEFLRLGGVLNGATREEAAASLARGLGCTVVLKGMGTVVTDGRSILRNPTGNPGMATGGSGDVLAGMIVSLLGQGLSPLDAASAAVWLHGRAGDLAASELGEYGMLPSDLLRVLPRLLP